MNAIELSIFSSRIESVCEEMGAVLRRAAFSTNIKDRLDFSCAVFDPEGALCAQAAHIPVHLGSMAYAMSGIVSRFDWALGDMVVVNDPYLGGTHLPDVTVVAPFFQNQRLLGFVANRAHHADIGAATPGSMPISKRLDEEGLVIAPALLMRSGALTETFEWIVAALNKTEEARGDFAAQVSANRRGLARLSSLADEMGGDRFVAAVAELNDYGERLSRQTFAGIGPGVYRFEDVMDDDGTGAGPIPIKVEITVTQEEVRVDFSGTAAQVDGNINCPLSVAAAAVYYVFRCLLPEHAPACAGLFRPIRIYAPEGCLVNARRPAAVAAGNVETSTRVVDVVIGALAEALPEEMPAASHGSMNNIAMGSRNGDGGWDYYETVGGGMGAGLRGGGHSAVQTHMTNTLNTPVEVLEMAYPLRVVRYAVRRGSGGVGRRPGGDGLIREFEFLSPARVTFLTERRIHAPWGLAGGGAGVCGENRLNGALLPAKASISVEPGDRISLSTPGGGGWGDPSQSG